MSDDSSLFPVLILGMEKEGLVSRTFRRLDPDRQLAVLYAILDEAYAQGPSMLNIKAVAQRAGVSVGALYTYFPDREGMLNFAVQLSVKFITQSFKEYRPILGGMPIRQALSAYLSGGIEWSRIYTGLLRLFARAAYQGDPNLQESVVRPVANSLRAMITEIMIQAAQRGEIRSDVNLEAVIRIIHALMIVIGDSQLIPFLNTYFQITDDEISFEQIMTSLPDFIMKGIGP